MDEIDRILRDQFGGVASRKGTVHDYLGITWDFSTLGQVSISMKGYINDIFAKYENPKLLTCLLIL